MKPRAFLDSAAKKRLEAGYLFLGNDLYYRDACRRALLQAALGVESAAEAPADALIEVDLRENSLARLLDETRTLSLFAPSRVIYGYHAEAAIPRALNTAAAKQHMAELVRYFDAPSPGVTIVLESIKFRLNERDDQAGVERVRKFFASAPATVEFERLSDAEALRAAEILAKRMQLSVTQETLAELVEMLGADMLRIRGELEKLSLFAQPGEPVDAAMVEMLVPEARQRGVFEFSEAVSARDRVRALDILDTLAKTGAYWPMQITLLSGLFRHALAVKENGARTPNDVMRVFRSAGVRMWPARAQQLTAMARKFQQEELERAVKALAQADRDLRDVNPDERITMERLVLTLTG